MESIWILYATLLVLLVLICIRVCTDLYGLLTKESDQDKFTFLEIKDVIPPEQTGGPIIVLAVRHPSAIKRLLGMKPQPVVYFKNDKMWVRAESFAFPYSWSEKPNTGIRHSVVLRRGIEPEWVESELCAIEHTYSGGAPERK